MATASVETPLTAKTSAADEVASSIPPSAGPINAAEFHTTSDRDCALGSASPETRTAVSAVRAGMSKASRAASMAAVR